VRKTPHPALAADRATAAPIPRLPPVTSNTPRLTRRP
jgi:hypothetical protein